MLTLVDSKTNVPVAYIKKDRDVRFTEKGTFMQKVLTRSGINIPVDSHADFKNKVVHFKREDPEFAKAFLEIYVPHSLRESGFRLIDSPDEVS